MTHLQQSTAEFVQFVENLSDETFVRPVPEKWTAGQHVEHLIKTTRPVNLALTLPRFLPLLLFGKPKSASRTYEEIAALYRAKLNAGAKAPKIYVPRAVSIAERQDLMARYKQVAENLDKLAAKWSEADLDNHLLPHPLLGKLTVREMLHFCAFHVQVHLAAVKRDLG